MVLLVLSLTFIRRLPLIIRVVVVQDHPHDLDLLRLQDSDQGRVRPHHLVMVFNGDHDEY